MTKVMNKMNYVALAMGILPITSQVLAQERPNVLVFLVDDLRPELGCYGNESIKSPNIDALADNGVRFRKAYVQEALSAPSRISMLTGMRPENVGIYSLFTTMRSKYPELESLPQFFKDRDYKTISVGKVYHHTRDDEESWTTLIPRSGGNYVLPENNLENGAKAAPFECADVEDNAYQDGRAADAAIEQLRQHKDDNFMMVVGFTKPHLPFNAPKKYWDMYDREQIEIPHKGAPEGNNAYSLAPWAELRAYAGMPKEGYVNDEDTKKLIHGYHACVSFTDAQIGKVVEELERLDLRRNTMIVLLGDHGWKLGEYGAWCKHSNSEIDTNIPFIISREGDYRKAKRGAVCDALIEAVDLYPTLADCCGFDVEGKDGKSVLPLTVKPNQKGWSSASYSLYPRGKKIMGFTCTDGEYRYTEWWNNETSMVVQREFYTCEQDYSIQNRNMVDDSEYAKEVVRMKKLLDVQFPESERSSYPQYDK